jgi:PAS domain S-box-containing protein
MDPAQTAQAELGAAAPYLAELFELASTTGQTPVEQIEAALQAGCRLLGAGAGAVVNCRGEHPAIVHFFVCQPGRSRELLERMQAASDELHRLPPDGVFDHNGEPTAISFRLEPDFICATLYAAGEYYGVLCFEVGAERAPVVFAGGNGAGANPLPPLGHWISVLLERQHEELQRFLRQESYRRIVELAQEGIVTVDTEECITLANTAFAGLLGYTPQELTGRTVLEFADEDSARLMVEGTNQRKRGMSSEYEVKLRTRAGGWRKLVLKASPLLGAKGEYEGALALFTDITERNLTDTVLRGIAEDLAGRTGQRLYESIVRQLGAELNVHAVLIGRIELDPTPGVSTIAVWRNGEIAPNFRYNLKGTLSERLMREPEVCSFAAGAYEQFPTDELLSTGPIESCAGCTLLSANGSELGILLVLDFDPFHDPRLVEQIVALYRLRASAELERQIADDKLRDSEDRFRSLLEDSHLAFALWQDSHFIYVNPALASLLGYDRPEQVIGRRIDEYFHPEDWSALTERHRRRIIGEESDTRYEARLVRRDGRIRWVELNMDLRDYHGVPAVQATLSDIHDRRLAEAALRTSEERYRRLVEDMAEGIIVIDKDASFLFANPAAEQIFGVASGTLTGRRLRDFLDADQRARAGAQRARRKPGEQSQYLLRLTRPDGQHREVVVRSSSQYNAHGAYIGSFAIVQDITEQSQAQRELQAAAERYSDLVESTNDIIVQVDREGHLAFVNRAAEELLGLPALELLHRPALELVHPDDAQSIGESAVEWVTSRRSNVSVECRVGSDEASTCHVLWSIHMKYDDQGKFDGANCIGHDYSQQLQLQERLLHEQKEESMTTLAGGLAHDFNNILMGVLGSASLLRESLSDGTPNAEVCDAIVTSAKRMSDLTSKLLAYARGGLFQPQPFFMNDVVRDSLAMLRGSIPAQVRVEHDLVPEIWPVEADPGQLNQVLLNLCVNACEAMGDSGGTLKVSTSNLNRPRGWHCPAHGEHPAGDYVQIEVRDTGSGMDQATLSRIFEPFFSTKFQGRGLGLAATMGIIRHHNGCISVESRLGEGTVFRVLLPRGERMPAAASAAASSTSKGVETVLVVDDEPVVLQTAQRMLERQGYRVLAASNARDALLLLAREGPEIDLLIIDMHMPTMGGSDVLKRLPGGTAHMRVLASSGYGPDYALEGIDAGLVQGFLQKPYTKTELLGAVRQALDLPAVRPTV